jgi:hypothetical protein
MHSIRRRWIAVAVMVTIVGSTIGVAGPSVGAAPVCVPLHATGVGQDHFDLTTTATISVLGVPIGTTAATFVQTDQVGSVVSFEGPIVFTAAVGHSRFTVSASGSVDLATGVFRSTGKVSGATGILREVGGELTSSGTENLTSGASPRPSTSGCANRRAVSGRGVSCEGRRADVRGRCCRGCEAVIIRRVVAPGAGHARAR